MNAEPTTFNPGDRVLDVDHIEGIVIRQNGDDVTVSSDHGLGAERFLYSAEELRLFSEPSKMAYPGQRRRGDPS